MSDGYTFATCVIPDSEKAAAQETYPAYFVVGLSADGSAPATHWVTSGALDNAEITEMVTHFPAGWKFDFGNDLSGALANWGLQPVQVEQLA